MTYENRNRLFTVLVIVAVAVLTYLIINGAPANTEAQFMKAADRDTTSPAVHYDHSDNGNFGPDTSYFETYPKKNEFDIEIQAGSYVFDPLSFAAIKWKATVVDIPFHPLIHHSEIGRVEK